MNTPPKGIYHVFNPMFNISAYIGIDNHIAEEEFGSNEEWQALENYLGKGRAIDSQSTVYARTLDHWFKGFNPKAKKLIRKGCIFTKDNFCKTLEQEYSCS